MAKRVENLLDRKAYLNAKEGERRSKQREGIVRLVMDWEAILEALERWDGDLEHAGELLDLWRPFTDRLVTEEGKCC